MMMMKKIQFLLFFDSSIMNFDFCFLTLNNASLLSNPIQECRIISCGIIEELLELCQ